MKKYHKKITDVLDGDRYGLILLSINLCKQQSKINEPLVQMFHYMFRITTGDMASDVWIFFCNFLAVKANERVVSAIPVPINTLPAMVSSDWMISFSVRLTSERISPCTLVQDHSSLC